MAVLSTVLQPTLHFLSGCCGALSVLEVAIYFQPSIVVLFSFFLACTQSVLCLDFISAVVCLSVVRPVSHTPPLCLLNLSFPRNRSFRRLLDAEGLWTFALERCAAFHKLPYHNNQKELNTVIFTTPTRTRLTSQTKMESICASPLIDDLYAARIPLQIDWFQTRILALRLPNIFCAQQLDLVMFYAKQNHS